MEMKAPERVSWVYMLLQERASVGIHISIEITPPQTFYLAFNTKNGFTTNPTVTRATAPERRFPWVVSADSTDPDPEVSERVWLWKLGKEAMNIRSGLRPVM
ncbi:hypothetical protein PM082_004694 [Marasmius tenuissimus]|nr:hypothetical protein PM082_004694 [Marasmius tenuissimus]